MFRTTRSCLTAIASLTMLAATQLGFPKSTTNTPAIITYAGSPTDSTYRFYSDGAGAYVDGSAGVSAFFFPSGCAGLNTEASTTRTLTLDLSKPLTSPSTGAPYPFNNSTVGPVAVNLSQQLLNESGSSGCLLAMADGGTGVSRIGLTFPDPEGRAYIWTIKWGSGVTNPTYACPVSTSRSVDGSYWTIDNTSCDYAELDYTSTTKGKSGTPMVYGYFDLPFSFTMQKK